MSSFTQDRTKLLSQLLQQKGITGATAKPIPRRESGDAPVASFLQEGLWFLDQLDPGRATYNVPGATRICGHLDVDALQRTLSEIVRRHEALRTRFRTEAGKPYQVILPELRVDLECTDLANLPLEESEAEVLRRATDEARSGFDLATGPLFRFALLRLKADEHVLILNIHHIVTDGWSMGVFTRELFALYEAYSKGLASPLPELPIQFSDFAVWQRKWLHGENLNRQLSYWQKQLRGPLPNLELPTDRPRPAFQTPGGSHLTMKLSDSMSIALRMLTKREDSTLFELLLAAFNILLHHYSGQKDIIVGSPVANRNRKELEPLIGYFVNMLPLRMDLSGNPGFSQLLERVHKVTMEAHEHQDLPFAKLVEELGLARDMSRNPVFQAEFILLTEEHAPPVYGYGFRSPIQEARHLAGLTLTPIDVESGVSKFDLVVLLWDMPDGISGTFEYKADLFDAETIQHMMKNFELLLSIIVAHPEIHLDTFKDKLAAPRQKVAELAPKSLKRASTLKLKNIKRRSAVTTSSEE